MKPSLMNRRGMSLIELLIVVSILAILAAIVVPRYSNASDSARGGNLATQLQTIKKALERYKNDHGGDYPTEAQLISTQWQVLINTTDITGDVSGSSFGPYFMKPPTNPFMDSSTVAADNSGAWVYDESTGTIQAVVPTDIYNRADELKLNIDDLVVQP